MNETLVGYEMVCISTGARNKLVGLATNQLGSFKYEVESKAGNFFMNIHASHFLIGDHIIVYNKSYVLKKDEVIYLLKDLGGE